MANGRTFSGPSRRFKCKIAIYSVSFNRSKTPDENSTGPTYLASGPPLSARQQ